MKYLKIFIITTATVILFSVSDCLPDENNAATGKPIIIDNGKLNSGTTKCIRKVFKYKRISLLENFTKKEIFEQPVINTGVSPEMTLSLYPQPVVDCINVGICSGGNYGASIRIHTVEGRSLIEKSINLTGGQNLCTIDVSSIETGTYYITLSYNGKTLFGRFIKR